MGKMKWEYVPFVGLIICLVEHWIATTSHKRNPTSANYEKIWAVDNKFFTSLYVTFSAIILTAIGSIIFTSK